MTEPSAPAPIAPKNNRLVVGCLSVAGLCILGVIGLMALGAIYKHFESPQQRAADKAREDREIAADKADQAAKLAPTLAAAKLALAHLAAVAAAVAPEAELKASACPKSAAGPMAFASVDADYMRRFHGRIPHDITGTAWLRDKTFADLADEGKSVYANSENDAYAANDADKKLTEVGRIGVIHATALKLPRIVAAGGRFSDGSFEAGEFTGWIQVIAYPAAKGLCEVPFSAASSASVGGGLRFAGNPEDPPQQQVDADFHANVLKAAQAAVDGTASSR